MVEKVVGTDGTADETFLLFFRIIEEQFFGVEAEVSGVNLDKPALIDGGEFDVVKAVFFKELKVFGADTGGVGGLQNADSLEVACLLKALSYGSHGCQS